MARLDETPADGSATTPREASRLGRWLVSHGHVSDRRLAAAEKEAARREARLADVLRLSLALPNRLMAEAEAEVQRTGLVDPVTDPPDLALVLRYGPALCLRHGLLPWQKRGTETIVLSARPEQFSRHRDALVALFGPVRMAVASEDRLQEALRLTAGQRLVRAAETRVPALLSSRSFRASRLALWTLGLAGLTGLGLALSPAITLAALCGWAILVLVLTTLLKLACVVAYLRRPPVGTVAAAPVPARLPVVTLLIPLFKEREIASHLLARLAALDYPRELLDVCLLLEQDDRTTRAVLDHTNLPRWIQAIVVPQGGLRTKPRALNYGLEFARGSIIGVYDAEDAPAPDQIRTVVARFAQSGPNVACLQGVLDFYNAGANWLSRCFTLDYAAWFRVILPGLQRMGLVIPLGGTTIFFRRDTLEKLGGWDAHNVTEDADLGLRLARLGYRTELIPSVTEEEANCRPWPWVKQRSRWLKGYAMTYGVHMRAPRQLWRDLGAWRFVGVQVMFLGTLSQFALAPLLWSFWALPLGLGHPLQGLLPPSVFLGLAWTFLVSEAVTVTAAALGARAAGEGRLAFWAPTLHPYFALATLAAYKGLLELFRRPFYWDKTAHGMSLSPDEVRPSAPPPAHPASGA